MQGAVELVLRRWPELMKEEVEARSCVVGRIKQWLLLLTANLRTIGKTYLLMSIAICILVISYGF